VIRPLLRHNAAAFYAFKQKMASGIYCRYAAAEGFNNCHY